MKLFQFFLLCMQIFPLVAQKCDNWIVITSINYPTKAVKQLAKLADWQLLVVGDKKTPQDWQLSDCIYLGPEDQKKVGYKIYDHLPWNHYARKNIGYLYAIEHGAQIIFDTDDDNLLQFDQIPLLPNKQNMLQCISENSIFNPYQYFGCPHMWPRGYPLKHIKSKQIISYKHQEVRPLVQQFLVNGDTDVDAIYRLTQGTPCISFSQKEPVSLEKGTFSPYNSQGTIYHYDAFWGLAIPITTKFRVCDIWRGYWVQRMLWDIDACMSFLPPAIEQERNAHDYFKDFSDEIDLYIQSDALIEFLKTWHSDSSCLTSRIMQLIKDMAQENYFKDAEIDFMEAWIEDLKKIGYAFPPV